MSARPPSSRPISHARAKLLVSKTWDGEVTEDELRRLVRHLAECPPCAAEAERMQAFLARLDRCFKARRRQRVKR